MARSIDSAFRFVVAGGGTAGWLSALWLRQQFPFCHVTVIDSSRIGIIGAGEGTVPPVMEFLQDININLSDLIRYCNTAIKLGIRFDRWSSNSRSSYYHSFAERDRFWYYQDVAQNSGRPLFAFDDADSTRHHRLLDLCMDLDCVTMAPRLDDDFANPDPRHRFQELAHHALHFDNFMLNRYLRSVATNFRQIHHVDAEIEGCELDANGNVQALRVQGAPAVSCDFVIDCTGLNRVIMSCLGDNAWHSYRDQLPVNSAVGFQRSLETGRIPTFTGAQAMSSGWCWSIPTQANLRCGYVFSKDHITPDRATEEIIAEHGTEVTIGKHFEFDAGHLERGWHRNCVAIGLANSFIEPLEATSIWQITMALRSFTENLPGMLEGNQYYRDRYNAKVRADIEEIRDFVFFHYVTSRTDTDFWQHFHDRTLWPCRVREIISAAESGYLPNWYDRLWGERFPMSSWWEVGKGLGIFDANRAKQLVQDLTHTREGQQHSQQWSHFRQRTELIMSSLIPHTEYLRFIKEN
jgi:hypothetical protein